MSSPPFAIVWQLWTRHRAGLEISAAILLLMVLVVPPALHAIDSPAFVMFSMIPSLVIATYVANLLTFSDEVGSFTSGYPRRMFVLPLPTRTLALWPMLVSMAVIVVLWLVISVFIYQRGGYHPPVLLPAIALAVTVAWNQAMCWMPFRSQLVQVYCMLAGLGLLVGLPSWSLVTKTLPVPVLATIGLLELPIIYALAVLGLRHARRGDDWSLGLSDISDAYWSIFDRLTRQPPSFRSASRAQLWFEARCHAWTIKGMALFALLMTFSLAIWSPARAGNKVTFGITLACLAGAPLFMVGSMGVELGRMHPIRVKRQASLTFLAVRPIRTGAMITSKYRVAAHCVLQVWLLSLVLTGCWVVLKGYTADMAELFETFFRYYPGVKGWAILGLASVLGPVLSWKLLTDSLVPVLTGRKWLADGAVLVNLVLLAGLVAAGLWASSHRDVVQRFLPWLTWATVLWVLLKVVLTAVIIRLALRRRIIGVREVFTLAAVWPLTAIAVMTFVHLLLPPQGLPVPRAAVLLSSLSVLPLARFALAPVALDWNRHW